MQPEIRTIKASIFAGITEMFFGIIMMLTGWGNWYFEHFHFFGVMGVCMIFYAYWLIFFMRRDGAWKGWK